MRSARQGANGVPAFGTALAARRWPVGRYAEASRRLPWEGLAQALTKASLRFLIGGVDHVVHAQDTGIDMTRVPSVPRDGFIIQPTGLDAERSAGVAFPYTAPSHIRTRSMAR